MTKHVAQIRIKFGDDYFLVRHQPYQPLLKIYLLPSLKNMHSLTKLSCLFLLSAFVKRKVFSQRASLINTIPLGVCAQTVTALYIPSIANSGGLDSESFFDGTFEGTQNGKSSFQLVLGSNDDDPDDGPDITPTCTLQISFLPVRTIS